MARLSWRASAFLLGSLFAVTSFDTLAHGTANAPAAEPQSADTRAIQFPDTNAYLTLTLDPHTHSVFSDGHVWPKIRVDEALRDGLDAIAITEHLEWQPHLADIPHPDRNRSYAEAAAAAANSNLLVLAGSEITREAPAGHINAIFIKDANALLQVDNPPADPAETAEYYRAAHAWPSDEAVKAASAQGAFVFWNHPYWTRQTPDGKARITDFHKKLIRSGDLHGIEIANGDDYSEEAFAIALEHKLTIMGVSDVHDLIDWDYSPHTGGHRPVTLVFALTRTPEAIKAALIERRTVVWFKNQLIGRSEHLTPLLHASLTISGGQFRPETQVVTVNLTNHSDARFVLNNTSKHTFMQTGDLVEVLPHTTASFDVKPARMTDNLDLEFVVLNALTAPKKHPTMRFSVEVPVAELTPPSTE